MKRFCDDRVRGIITACIVLAALLLLLSAPKEYLLLLSAALIATAALITCFVNKKRSIHSHNKGQVLILVAVISVLYLTLYYFTGLEFGFVISPKGNISELSFIKSVLPVTAIIVGTEIIREVLAATPTKAAIPFCYAIGVASELLCAGGIPEINSSYRLADFFGMTVFPALTANLLFVYLVKRYGKAPCLAYRLILTLYVYLIPAAPNLPNMLPAFVLMLLPLATYVFIDMLFEKKIRIARRSSGKMQTVFSCLLVALIFGFLLLISCRFRFGMLVVATDSMTGEINKGDAIIYEEYDRQEEIQKGDVIVFRENNSLVVHRVTEINTVNGQRQYITKGDANERIDAGFRTDSDIVGVVRIRVLYIGYPSVWLHQLINTRRGGVYSV